MITIRGMARAGTLQDLLSRQMQSGGGKLYSYLDVCMQVFSHALLSTSHWRLQQGLPTWDKASSSSCQCI